MRVAAPSVLPLVLALALACAHAAGPAPVPKPAEADIQAMIEALMPASSRSMRNLLVRQKPEGSAAGVTGVASGASAAAAAAVAAVPVAPASAPSSAPAGPPPSLALAIQFEANSSRVRPESGAVLGSLVAAMQSPELKGTRFVIEGHADPRGAAAANQRLSQERADEVRLYLVALGVHPARLRAVGRGATRLAKLDDPTAAENRRVRVVTVE